MIENKEKLADFSFKMDISTKKMVIQMFFCENNYFIKIHYFQQFKPKIAGPTFEY